jgi:hypothetical protein
MFIMLCLASVHQAEYGSTNSCTLAVARQLPETRDVSVDACHVGVVTDPDCLGPCEPGTTVTLEGIVWNETENGEALFKFIFCALDSDA